MRRISLVVNAKAGGMISASADALAEDLARPFRERGDLVTVSCAEPKDVEAALSAAVKASPDILLAGGGDGTQRSAGRLLMGKKETALGVLPLGTLNVLSQMLGLPRDPRAAAAAIAAGERVMMDAAEVNGQVFFCNAMLGLTLVFSEERARLRGAPLMTRLVGYGRLASFLLQSTETLSLEIDHGPERRRVRAISVVATNNPYRDDKGLTVERAALDSGELGFYVARHESGWRLARGLLRIALGGLRDDPELDAWHVHEVVLTSRRHRRFRISVDGEIERLESPLVFRSLPKALSVMVPAGSVHAASAAGAMAT